MSVGFGSPGKLEDQPLPDVSSLFALSAQKMPCTSYVLARRVHLERLRLGFYKHGRCGTRRSVCSGDVKDPESQRVPANVSKMPRITGSGSDAMR